ncbi:MAG: ATP-binding protein, partial [Oscillospiraceae bacterium]|nr:ATP-binding protein [Oscillospiraceae bacterium]
SLLGRCENPVIDAFLYGRVEEAKKQGIAVNADIILPVELPISNTDLVIVFGNIMDNAVEACARVVHPSIRLDARIEGSYLIITEENPALPEAEDNKKRRIPELERGVGMHILESVAQKHNGSCLIETKDGKFTVSVILRLYRSKI